MRWTTLIAANDTVRTGLLLASAAAIAVQSRSRLTPYVTDWSYTVDGSGCAIVQQKVAILNKSQSDQMIGQVFLKTRKDKSLRIAPEKLEVSWRGRARLRLGSRRVVEVCGKDEMLTLPTTVKGGALTSGWLAFVMEPGQLELAKLHKWHVAAFDLSGKEHRSAAKQDQSIG